MPAANRSSRLSSQTCSPRAIRVGKRSPGSDRKNWSRLLVAAAIPYSVRGGRAVRGPPRDACPAGTWSVPRRPPGRSAGSHCAGLAPPTRHSMNSHLPVEGVPVAVAIVRTKIRDGYRGSLFLRAAVVGSAVAAPWALGGDTRRSYRRYSVADVGRIEVHYDTDHAVAGGGV